MMADVPENFLLFSTKNFVIIISVKNTQNFFRDLKPYELISTLKMGNIQK